ncbi:MAG: CpXC domain-containing protein [Lachnospiraceae bacterium]|nr:CpXC domain-containing protein [Lachnospiraceae bacterium]
MAVSEMTPKSMEMKAICPYCGDEFDYTVYPEITIPGDHKLKKRILNKSLYFPTCPHCNKEVKMKPNCIYRDENRKELFIATDVKSVDFETLMKTGDIGFNDIHSDDDVLEFIKGLYKRRVVHDIDAFREKILLSDYNYDDRIIELMKLSLSGLLEKENHMPVYRIFLENSSGNMMEFTAIMGSHAPFEYMDVKVAANVYTQFKKEYLNKLGSPEDDEYIATDQKWAADTGLLKDHNPGFIFPM